MTTTEGAHMDTEGAPEIGPWVDGWRRTRARFYAGGGGVAASVHHTRDGYAWGAWAQNRDHYGAPTTRHGTAPTRDEAERRADAALDEIARSLTVSECPDADVMP